MFLAGNCQGRGVDWHACYSVIIDKGVRSDNIKLRVSTIVIRCTASIWEASEICVAGPFGEGAHYL